MPVDPAKLNLIAYAGDLFGTPISAETLDRALDLTDLAPGDMALDLGTGHGQAVLPLARRGLVVDAVERHALVADAARRRFATVADARITVHVAESTSIAARPGGWRLVVALGSGRLAGQDPTPAAILRRLGQLTSPEGWVLWGETDWREPPPPRLAAVAAATGTFFGAADRDAAGREVGLCLVATFDSSQAELDAYTARYVGNIERWAAVNADDPDAPALAAWAHAWRDLYAEEARGVMGFALSLFRRGAP